MQMRNEAFSVAATCCQHAAIAIPIPMATAIAISISIPMAIAMISQGNRLLPSLLSARFSAICTVFTVRKRETGRDWKREAAKSCSLNSLAVCQTNVRATVASRQTVGAFFSLFDLFSRAASTASSLPLPSLLLLRLACFLAILLAKKCASIDSGNNLFV